MRKPEHFVTNFRTDEVDVDVWLEVAEELGFRAWIGTPFYVRQRELEPLLKGFYISKEVKNLGEFWRIVNERIVDS